MTGMLPPVTALLAEMASLVDRHNIVDKGRVVWTGTPAQMAADPDLAHRYLGI